MSRTRFYAAASLAPGRVVRGRPAGYELFGTFSDPGRVAAYADGNVFQLASLAFRWHVADVSLLRPSLEWTELRFFERPELPPADLVPTHRGILERYLSGAAPPFLD